MTAADPALLVLAALCAAAASRLGRPRPAALRRLRKVLATAGGPTGRYAAPAPSRPAMAAATLLGLAVGLFVVGIVDGAVGTLLGLVAGTAATRAARRGLAHLPHTRDRVAAPPGLARALDLLAVALDAGLPLGAALVATGEVQNRGEPDRLGAALVAAGRAVQLGGRPDDALGVDLPALAGPAAAALVTAVRRSGESGGRLAGQLRHVADDVRRAAEAEALARARRVEVLAVLPLGLCALPAFVLLSTVPVVLGLAREVVG